MSGDARRPPGRDRVASAGAPAESKRPGRTRGVVVWPGSARALFLGRGLLGLGRGLGGGLRARPSAPSRPSSAAAFLGAPSSRWPWSRWSPGRLGLGGVAVALASAAAAFAAAASARAVLLSAARALPAAVWAPFALPALPAAMRALAAFAAAALPVVLTTRPPVWTCSPPSAALTLRVRRDLRRAAAFGWIAPTLAARSSALSASARAATGSIVDVGRAGGGGQGLRDERLRGGAAGLQDLVAALGLTDPLESGRRASARPGAGRLGQVGNLE